LTSLAAGFSQARRRPKLVATVWAWTLLLAAAATAPFARWLGATLPRAPEADLLARRFSFGLLAELLQGAGPAMELVAAAVGGAALLAFLGNPLIAGGVLEVLGSEDDRPFLHRFFRGAGHFYGRFLRLLLLAVLAAAIVAGALAVGLRRALRPLRESAWEPGSFVAGLLSMIVVMAVAAFFWLVLDYARIRVSRDDSRRMLRAFIHALRLVAGHPLKTFGLLIAVGIVLLAAALAYLAFRNAVPSHTWGLIVLMAVAQQAFMLVRAGLRVALLASERELHSRLRPVAGDVNDRCREDQG
jgi:hypothetical protein